MFVTVLNVQRCAYAYFEKLEIAYLEINIKYMDTNIINMLLQGRLKFDGKYPHGGKMLTTQLIVPLKRPN